MAKRGGRSRKLPSGGGGAGTPATPTPGEMKILNDKLKVNDAQNRIGRTNVNADGSVDVKTYGTSLAPFGKKKRLEIQAQRRSAVEAAAARAGYNVKWSSESQGQLVNR